eukprot:jgi/Hompol1/4657/HPOL_001520-RA
MLQTLLRTIYQRFLMVDPKQKRVIICENLFTPVELKRTLAALLFHRFGVPSITFIPAPAAALLATGIPTGLVVDCGYYETCVLPIYDGVPLIPYSRTIPLAGYAVTQRLKKLIYEHGSIVAGGSSRTGSTDSIAPHQATALLNRLPESFWEDIKARVVVAIDRYTSSAISRPSSQTAATAAAANANRRASSTTVAAEPASSAEQHQLQQDLQQDPQRSTELTSPSQSMHPISHLVSQKMMEIEMGTGQILQFPDWIRDAVIDVLFEGDEEGDSMQSCLLKSLMKCPSSIRLDLVKNVLVTGGTFSVPGLDNRLKHHVQHLVDEDREFASAKALALNFDYIFSPFQPALRVWIGGSLAGAVKMKANFELTREDFLNDSRVPDWSQMYSNEQ